MIVLKHFDIANQKLSGVGKVYVPRASKVGDLVPIINERMRWSSSTPLKLYEVIDYSHTKVWASVSQELYRKSNLA